MIDSSYLLVVSQTTLSTYRAAAICTSCMPAQIKCSGHSSAHATGEAGGRASLPLVTQESNCSWTNRPGTNSQGPQETRCSSSSLASSPPLRARGAGHFAGYIVIIARAPPHPSAFLAPPLERLQTARTTRCDTKFSCVIGIVPS